MQATELKIVIVGPPCGKTSFLKEVMQLPYKKYRPTCGVSVQPYEVGYIGRQKYHLNMWEVGSQYPGLGAGYCTGAALGLVFSKAPSKYDICGDDTRYDLWIPPGVPRLYVMEFTVADTPKILEKIREVIFQRDVHGAL